MKYLDLDDGIIGAGGRDRPDKLAEMMAFYFCSRGLEADGFDADRVHGDVLWLVREVRLLREGIRRFVEATSENATIDDVRNLVRNELESARIIQGESWLPE